MGWIISDAYAESAAGASGVPQGIESFFLLIAFFVVFYVLMIRPQLRRQKEQRNLIAALQKGDEVATTGGVLGRVSAVDEQYLTVEIARGVEVRLQKPAVVQVLPKGTVKFG